MRTRTTVLTVVILAALLFSFKPTENPIKLNGQIKLNPKVENAYVEGLIVFVKIDGRTVGKTVADKNGNFSLTLNNYNGKQINIFCYCLSPL